MDIRMPLLPAPLPFGLDFTGRPMLKVRGQAERGKAGAEGRA